MEISIAHLYPDLLNLYGDCGNIITLKRRLEKRGIEAKVTEYELNDKIDFFNTTKSGSKLTLSFFFDIFCKKSFKRTYIVRLRLFIFN